MRRQRPILIGLVLLLVACDGESPATDAGTDAGTTPFDAGSDAGTTPVDAGTDAGTDAGPGDAGPGDAGVAPDGGPPTPAEVAVMVETDLADLTTAIAAVPVDERVDGAFCDLDVAAGGIDALVGEDGLMTLSLSDGAVRALSDLRQANLLIDVLDRAILALAARVETEVVAARTAAEALRARLVTYRGSLAALFRGRVDAGIVGSPVVSDAFYVNLTTTGTIVSTRLAAVVEGDMAVGGQASVTLECFGMSGTSSIVRFEVIDEETGAVLGTTTGTDSAILDIDAPFDDVTPIAILFQTNPGMVDMPDYCNVSVLSRRRLRTAALALSPTGPFVTAYDALSGTLSPIAVLTESPPSGVDPGVARAVLEQHIVLLDLVAPLRASEALPIPIETYQEMARRVVHVRAMTDALLAHPGLAVSQALELRGYLATAMTAVEDMIREAQPPPP